MKGMSKIIALAIGLTVLIALLTSPDLFDPLETIGYYIAVVIAITVGVVFCGAMIYFIIEDYLRSKNE